MSDKKSAGSASFHWYPGHMTKAKREMQEDIKLVDLVIELLDARIPLSSRNPDIDELSRGRARLVLLNKSDLADEAANKEWLEYFKKTGVHAVLLDSRNRSHMKKIEPMVKKACSEKLERDKKRGIIGRPVRAMVAGIPNVGKSTFINSYAGRACAKTGNRPGVTKGRQWIRLGKNLELLDTPGILWPRFEDARAGKHLAFIGSMNDSVLPTEELAVYLAGFLSSHYEGLIEEHYPAEAEYELPEGCDGSLAMLYRIAMSRRALIRGGEPDIKKAALILLDDFRAGRLGRITIERP